jgi:hypothetical protein
MNGTYIYYCRRAMLGTSAPPLLSQRAAIYSPVPFIGCAGRLSHTRLRSGRSADLRSKEFALVWLERLARAGYLLGAVHLLTHGVESTEYSTDLHYYYYS